MTEAAPSPPDRYPQGTAESSMSECTLVRLDILNGDQSVQRGAEVRNRVARSVENKMRGNRIQENEGEEGETEVRRTEKENEGEERGIEVRRLKGE
ncbi:hypothetical protein NDU88_006713 [Pleurodeles waltl]|uniref:Uncharacterized protein n=1 Tax=Pleurodeles waltl TaxID=8319 RepID=A0AAV7PM62_PLEWA|nr:hypothetical protein NDU88_006713 [Pleurodeles waltl]